MSVLRQILARPLAVFGLIIVFLTVVFALFAPWLTPYEPNAQMFDGLTIEGAPLPPSAKFWLGTDLLGRDLFTRLVYGAQTSLIIGIVANGAAVTIGAFVGITAGFFRGWIGAILMRFTDLMMAFPALLLAIVLAAIFKPSLWIVALVIAMVNWVQVARVIYSQAVSLSERDFITAERSLGAGSWRILYHHILPHMVPHFAGVVHFGHCHDCAFGSDAELFGCGCATADPELGQHYFRKSNLFHVGALAGVCARCGDRDVGPWI